MHKRPSETHQPHQTPCCDYSLTYHTHMCMLSLAYHTHIYKLLVYKTLQCTSYVQAREYRAGNRLAHRRELYQALIAPVEVHLTGAKELLIVPHQTLFETPWAALIDSGGGYLIEKHVIRITPSLHVGNRAAEARVRKSMKVQGRDAMTISSMEPKIKASASHYASSERAKVKGLGKDELD